MPLIGVGMLFLGTRNLIQDFQLINSPFDQLSDNEIAPDPRSSSRGNRPEIGDSAEVEFLPVMAPSEGAQTSLAPSMEKIVPSQEGSFQGQDLQNKLSIRDDESTAEATTPLIRPPERLVIESLGVDHPVAPVDSREVQFQGETYQQWRAPRSGDLGWHQNSARLGAVGNTVINGHSSGYGETFRDLETLQNGDLIQVFSGDVLYTYTVANILVLKERWEPMEVRMENARWISPSRDERLTLISCWPYSSNTHRVVVVARPHSIEQLSSNRTASPGDTSPLLD